MSLSRIFVPQETLETWLASGNVHMVGERLIVEGQPCELAGAVHFVQEVTGGPDEHHLVGRVKPVADLSSLGGELCAGSVVLGENAYDVIEGFLVSPDGSKPVGHDDFVRLFANR